MDVLDVMRWGRTTDGGRHLVHTQTHHLGTHGVTAVALCGADLETVAGSAPLDDYSFLFCAHCTTATGRFGAEAD